ncbi:MAG: methylmalonyl-CoA mutase family protein [Cyclobacteriaceae bacterium]|nr:methylmalonyl-CoA mutase family protein [Cyclobacteriaceae bacterium]
MTGIPFTKTSWAEWAEAVKSDLKKDEIESVLGWDADTVRMGAYYDDREAHEARYISAFFREITHPTKWKLYQLIKVNDVQLANSEAVTALRQGVDGLLFSIENQVDPTVLYRDILPQHCAVSFTGNSLPEAVTSFFTHFSDLDQTKFHGFSLTHVPSLHGYPNFRNMPIELSASEPLVSGLSHALGEFDRLLHSGAENIADSLIVMVHGSTSFYQEIVRLRAIRFLFSALALHSNQPISPAAIHIHFVPQPEESYESTLISNTSIGIAGITGGANSLHFQLPNAPSALFSAQMNRNVGHILREEAFLAFEKDPVAGSYFFDVFTHKLCQAVWQHYTH